MTNPGSVPDLHAFDAAAAALDEGWSLPFAWMGGPAIHAFEQGAIFKRSWQVAMILAACRLALTSPATGRGG